MKSHDYVNKMKKIQIEIICYLDLEDADQEHSDKLVNFIYDCDFQEDKDEFKSFLLFLLNILNNHHRNSEFFNKIFYIIHSLSSEIKNSFTNKEIFSIFKENKRILLFLHEEQILKINEYIASEISKLKYDNYFYPEIKSFKKANAINETSTIEHFDEMRKLGENDNYICQLIRNDNIDEFIVYINKKNFPILTTKIQPSIFETNCFLLDKQPNLIEYSAFFGSIQIFRYLLMNSAKLTSSLWLYSIHGSNPELIHLLEENNIEPFENYETLFIEAIKCHHNEIAKYFLDNFITNQDKSLSFVAQCSKYYNFEFIEFESLNQSSFYGLCENNNSYLVKILIEDGIVDLNQKQILISLASYGLKLNLMSLQFQYQILFMIFH